LLHDVAIPLGLNQMEMITKATTNTRSTFFKVIFIALETSRGARGHPSPPGSKCY
jgi:hypothetical protein